MENENITNAPELAENESAPVQDETNQQSTEIINEEPAPQTEVPVETVAVEAAPIEVATEAVVAEAPATEEAKTENTEVEKKEEAKKQDKYAPVFEELAEKKANNEIIEVLIKDRIRGGLRVVYKDAPLFLPASHFSMRRTPSEQELIEAVGKNVVVEIHEIQEYDEGRRAVIVTRKNLLVDEFWSKLSIGDIVEGKVSSVATFGVFIDIGGIEGLIHISRLSQFHIDDPSKLVKKGDLMRAVVVELNKEKNRIALSRKELEESPWTNVNDEFPIDTIVKGVVRRLTDFGAYIELKPGVDGLLRTQEISWTKRIKTPSEVFKAGQQIDVKVLSINQDKRNIALSYRETTPNPWPQLVDSMPVGTEFEGTVFQVMPQGMIVTVGEGIDGFVPRSKMRKILQGNKIPYQTGDKLTVFIADIIPQEESLILAPKVDESEQVNESSHSAPRPPRHPRPESSQMKIPQAAGISLLDMLSEEQKQDLMDKR